ncbi:thioredoxin-like protein [Gonapodya prolifera JEL478]|uniref:Thioredoxin-like protein n=1 Tax=Gonapodya prolifera (strain JEL478) TaxID=1344416 RepID=A0A139AK71_GONPJ|nr:thioredoxin-like protein [Gonapodya prolifera JEL478]|eukprot:KXS17166.1 thioredoxin-like protein [Gonapodya prolifera JEL478]
MATTASERPDTPEREDRYDDEEDIFKELEREDDYESAVLRERRLKELQRQKELLESLNASSRGTYETLQGDRDVLKATTTAKYCVVHFAHKEFRRCQIVDKHLEILARKHLRTRFVKVDVGNAPFLVERLKVQVLPCVACFVDGVEVDRVIGFEELGNTDNFTTPVFERRLSAKNVIKLSYKSEEEEEMEANRRKKGAGRGILGFPEENSDNEDD